MVFALEVPYISSLPTRRDSMEFECQLHYRNINAEVQINRKLILLKSWFGISATCDSLNRIQSTIKLENFFRSSAKINLDYFKVTKSKPNHKEKNILR